MAATLATLAWGTFAFGGAYAWTSWPLMVGCVVAGLLAWSRGRGSSPRWLLVAIGAVTLAVALQLVPVPEAVITALSPQTPGVVAKLAPAGESGPTVYPLSIWPHATGHALALFVACSVLLVGLTRLFNVTGTRWMLASLTVLGVVLALVGMALKATWDGKIYGVWAPEMSGDPFGPFVNRNHFAGWMLMALPLTLALLSAGIARGFRHVKPTVRDRLLWIGSRESSEAVLTGAAAVVMGIALVMTMSRSGMTSLGLAVALTAVFVSRGMSARARRSVVKVYLVALIVIVVGWVGLNAVVTRFAAGDWTSFNGRIGHWTDAWNIAGRFPITGTGLNTYGIATHFFQQHDLTAHAGQAHNDYLQLAAEGGLLLVLPAVVLVLVIVAGIVGRFREDDRHSTAWWARAGAVTGLVSIALQETVEFSLQMPANAMLFTILCAIALHRSGRCA